MKPHRKHVRLEAVVARQSRVNVLGLLTHENILGSLLGYFNI